MGEASSKVAGSVVTEICKQKREMWERFKKEVKAHQKAPKLNRMSAKKKEFDVLSQMEEDKKPRGRTNVREN